MTPLSTRLIIERNGFRVLKRSVKFGLLNAVIGVLVGMHLAVTAIGSGYWVFIIAAPIAALLTAGIAWRFFQSEAERIEVPCLFIIGLITGSVSHYITFVLLGVAMNVLYWIGAYGGDSLGNPPPNLLMVLAGSFATTLYSLLFYGWVTVPASILAGFLVKWLEPKSPAVK
ncbi:MAG: hypothetical protein IPP83_13435 [Flavobacteriales bacterium]|nr:hypothetical protein [Flavobacteriales bacterium]